MNQWNPKQSPMQGMSGLWGGISSNLTSGTKSLATYPDTNMLHLEAQNFTPGDSTWTQSTNSNSNYAVNVNYTNDFTKTGSGNTQRIVFPNSGPTYFRAENVQVPVGIQVVCAWAENQYPFILEQSNGSSTANSAPGFYFYGNNGFIYGCYRSTWTSGTGTGRRDINGIGDDWFVTDGTFAVGGFVVSANSDATNSNKATTTQVMRNNTKYTDYTIEQGGFPSNSVVTQNIYIGSRNGTSIFLHGGQLAEVWMAPTDSGSNYLEVFEDNVAAMVSKYGL